MKIQTYFVQISLFLVTFFCTSCLYIETEHPGGIQTGTLFELKSGDYKVIKRVTVIGESSVWFGLVALGGKGYQSLLKKSQEIGGDTIMDYSFDYEIKSIVLFIYGRVNWKATGLAVKLTESVIQ